MLRQVRLSLLSLLLAPAALSLGGCGGSMGGSAAAMPSQNMAHMRLAVADAPLDGATHVVVVFTSIELTGNGGNPVTITFPTPKSIDLMTQSGTASAVLFDQPIPAGSYGQIRLMVLADGTGNNSYVELAEGTVHGLLVPSGAETGLKLVSGFTVPSSGVADYTIDFDLRKGITCPPGQAPACLLKPAERLVANNSVGNIQGQIKSALPAGCAPGVYLYNGTVTHPEDMNSAAAAADPNQPIASKVPVANSLPPYYYQFTFLPPGSYTIAFTCQANQDNPDQPDPSVILVPVSTTNVTAGQTQTLDITLGGIQGQVTLPSGCSVPGPGVYLYYGSVTAPEDWNSNAPSNDPNQPLASTVFASSAQPTYSYQFTAVPPGTYTVALTCQATQDNRAEADPGVMFGPVKTGVVTADQATTVNIP